MPPKKRFTSAQPPEPAQEDSDVSDEMSDPEQDIEEEEEASILASFECVRDAARERLAPRTRYQYDLFMRLMVRFFMSESDLKHLVDDMTCMVPLPAQAVSRYLDHVESKKVQYKPGHFKVVSTSYFNTVVRSIHDKYVCEQIAMQEDLRLLLFSRQRIFRRRVADLKAAGSYPQAPSRCISGHGYSLVCDLLAKSKPADEGG